MNGPFPQGPAAGKKGCFSVYTIAWAEGGNPQIRRKSKKAVTNAKIPAAEISAAGMRVIAGRCPASRR